jgi:Cu+-exporting ATPase
MLEEDRQVGLDHVPQRDVGRLAHLGSIADDTWPEESPVAMVTDPVCGMRIDEDDAAATAEYEGRTYYFCSEACRDSFVSDPASYAA